jgi:hypothetical protein
MNGWRPVFLLGNELGECPLKCKFCNVRTSKRISSKNNIKLFTELYDKYSNVIDGSYHPLIYNHGNVTHSKEFSRETLNHILDVFNADNRVKFVSINSREIFATKEVLDYLANKKLNYPLHFILGIESFSKNIIQVLGKNSIGELPRLAQKLRTYNLKHNKKSGKEYIFGIDVNLLFLPELYVEKREENNEKIRIGIQNEIKQLLEQINPDVPVEINIHPFCQVETLPYEDAPLDVLVSILPELQEMIQEFNKINKSHVHLFIGVEGEGYDSRSDIQRWKDIIDTFNQTGYIE